MSLVAEEIARMNRRRKLSDKVKMAAGVNPPSDQALMSQRVHALPSSTITDSSFAMRGHQDVNDKPEFTSFNLVQHSTNR
jgi:hypothetical protein